MMYACDRICGAYSEVAKPNLPSDPNSSSSHAIAHESGTTEAVFSAPSHGNAQLLSEPFGQVHISAHPGLMPFSQIASVVGPNGEHHHYHLVQAPQGVVVDAVHSHRGHIVFDPSTFHLT